MVNGKGVGSIACDLQVDESTLGYRPARRAAGAIDGRSVQPEACDGVAGVREAGGATEDHRPHDLRHTRATQLQRLRHDAGFVSKRLGHRDVALTLEVHGHVIPGMLEDAAARFESETMPPLEARWTFR